jgi:hypothetical protein
MPQEKAYIKQGLISPHSVLAGNRASMCVAARSAALQVNQVWHYDGAKLTHMSV